MKRYLYASVSVVIVAISLFLILQLGSKQESLQNDVEIQNVHVQPATIKVGDTFSVNATLVNNSGNLIYVNYSPRKDLSSVTFDDHVTVDVKPVVVEDIYVGKKVNPGEIAVKIEPASIATFRATTAGTVNATIEFSYSEDQPHGDSKTISKSFSFTISDG